MEGLSFPLAPSPAPVSLPDKPAAAVPSQVAVLAAVRIAARRALIAALLA